MVPSDWQNIKGGSDPVKKRAP